MVAKIKKKYDLRLSAFLLVVYTPEIEIPKDFHGFHGILFQIRRLEVKTWPRP